MKPSVRAQARLREREGLGLVFSAGLLTLSKKITAKLPSRINMATLKNAVEMKAISDSLDLTPILENIGDTCLSAASNGDYEVAVSIKDSVYAKRLQQIGDALVALGYEIGFMDGFQIKISWKNAK